jgi:hypothetical protein
MVVTAAVAVYAIDSGGQLNVVVVVDAVARRK